MSLDGFMFEGRVRTASQLAREFPALSRGRWQTVLERGFKELGPALEEGNRIGNEMAVRSRLAARENGRRHPVRMYRRKA